MTIYVVKSLYDKNSRADTVGFFRSKEEALKLIQENAGKITDDGLYKYVLVFPAEEGFGKVTDIKNVMWFQYSRGQLKQIPTLFGWDHTFITI